MDITRRKITKIAREVSRFADRTLRAPGVGSAEYDLINLVRQNPGITQKELSRILGVDKSTVARQAANLEKKGYIERTENPADGRSQLLQPTEKAAALKRTRAHTEAIFYEWLLEGLDDNERAEFARLIDKLNERCREESLADFVNVSSRIR